MNKLHNNFNILQANIQSLLEKKGELIQILNESDYLAVLLSETWTMDTHEEKYNIASYNKIIKSRDDGYGGVAIFIKNTVNFEIIDLNSTQMVEIVGIEIKSLNLVLVSIYVNPGVSSNEFKTEIKKLLLYLNAYEHVIIGGDFNSHHVSWGCAESKRRGENLLNIINLSRYILLNDGSITHTPRDINKRPSAIDLSLCSGNLKNQVNWLVEDNSFGRCAHKIIKITFKSELAISDPTRNIACKNKVYEEIEMIKSNSFVDLQDLQEDIGKIVRKHTRKIKFKPKNFWSEELSELYNIKRIALKNFNRISNAINLKELNRAEAKFIQVKNIEKRKSVLKLIETISPQTSSMEAWKIIRNIKGYKTKTNTSNKINNDFSMAEKFMKLNYNFGPIIEINNTPIAAFNIEMINLELWKRILSEKSAKSAPGDDKISYSMLNRLNEDVVNKVIKELNLIYNTGSIPTSLKTIKIIAIPKPGRDHSLIEGYKPISLEQTLFKVLNSGVHDVMVDIISIKIIYCPITLLGSAEIVLPPHV